MFWKKSKVENEKLDNLGKLLLKASALNKEEVEKIANSPELYIHLRANIRKETLKRSETGDNWLAIWSIARYALPVMALLAMITLGSFWALDVEIEQVRVNTPNYLPSDINLVPVTACSISSKAECIVSSNDVISIVFQETEEIK